MEPFLTSDGKYRIECLSSATFPGALKVIKEVLCQEEPVCIGTEMNKNSVAIEELLELCADAALDGVSLVAISADTGEVVSALFNKLQVPSSNMKEKPFFEVFAEERCTQASSAALIAFMAQLDDRCNFFEKYGVDCSLELMFIATFKKHRGQKVGSTLLKTSLDLPKILQNGPVAKMSVSDLGPAYAHITPRKPVTCSPKICQALWTVKTTQKIGKALGFDVELKVKLKDFVYNGKTYEERIGHEQFVEAAVKILD